MIRQGKGIPLLLLHGWGSEASRWLPVIKALADNGFDVMAPDLPGFGMTPAPDEVWGVAEYAKWVLALGRQYWDQPFWVLGHSFGGRIGIYLGAKEPAAIDRLILCSAAGIVHHDVLTRTKKMLFKHLSAIGKQLIGDNPQSRGRRLLYQLARAHDYEQTSGVMRAIMAKVVEEDLSTLVGQIQAPCLLVWGEQDTMTPLRDGKRIFELLTGPKQLVIQRGARHGVHLTHPQTIVDAVTQCREQPLSQSMLKL